MSEQNNEELNTQTQLETTTSIAKIDMRDALAESFSSYAREVIMDRALPDLRDGLLPVQRRIIYAMNESRYTHTKPMVKSAKIVGDVMGKYHAHGDCIDRDTLVYLDTGEVRTIGDLYEETQDDPNKTYGIYAVDEEGKLVRATLSDVRVGQYADEVYHITLSNGYTLKVTSNHPFLAYNQEWVKAEDLTVNTPLFNARLYDDLGYPKIATYSKYTKTRESLLNLVKEELANNEDELSLNGHHINENRYDNSKGNIALLTDEEHAKVHGGNEHTLRLGNKTMFSGENQEYREAIRKKNSELMRVYNQNQYLIKALKIVEILESEGLEVNEANYNKYRLSIYNGTTIARLKERGVIKDDISELVGFNFGLDTETSKGHTKHLQDARRIERNNKQNQKRVKRYLKGNSNMYRANVDTVINLIEKGKELSQSNYIEERLNFVNSKDNITRTKLVEDINEYFSYTDFEGVLYITDIQIEQTKQRPMYDFTVEGVANALFVASSDNQTFVSLHNSSIYGAMVRQSQDWIVGNPLIDFQGNNGSIDGDGAASMRYTEARLSKSAKYLLEGLHKQGVVDWVKNYDDTLEEPVFLPAQYPNILVQGVKGISVGYATDIPPHNLKEMLESCILLIDDPTLTYSKLKVKGPDLPTGGTIVNGKDLAKLYSTGAGSVKVRGNFRIEQANKRSKLRQIVFYEIPYGANKPDIVGQIKDLLDDKQLNGVRDVRDESGSEGIRLVVEIDRDANSEVLTEILFKKTALESRVNVNCVMISGKKPKLMPLVDILNEFNEFRLETVRKELLADNQVDLNRSHILEGLLILSQHTDAIIKLVKESQGKSDARDQLIAKYSLSEIQANAILELQIHRMSRVSQDEYQDELNQRQEQINQRNTILNDDELLKYEVKNGYQSIIDDLGTSIKRKTKVVRDVKDVDITVNNLIQQEQVAVGIDEEGNLKRSTLRSYHATESKGNEFTLLTDTHKHVLIWTSQGNYVYYPVFNIKEGRWGDEGPNITSYGIKLEPDERIIGISEHDPDAQVLVIRNTGRGKVTNAKDLEMARINNIYSLGGVRTNETVSYVGLVKGDEAIEIVTSRYVKKDKSNLYERLVFSLSDLEPLGVKAGGRSLVKIAKSKTLERVTIVESLDTSADDIGGSTKVIETQTAIPNNVYNQQPQFFIDESLLKQMDEEDVDDEGLDDCDE